VEQAVITFDVALVLFCIAMVANVVALVRHFRLMRMMAAELDCLIRMQNDFNQMIDDDFSRGGKYRDD
jgi:hypothetical protein